MSKLLRVLSNKDYINHLYSDDIDGYIQTLQIIQSQNKKIINIKNYKGFCVIKALDEYTGKKDVFITPNSTYNGKRDSQNIRQFRTLYIDLDCREYEVNDIVYRIWDLVNEDIIPEPTMIVASGRGVHAYWRIKHAPYQAIATWQELEDYLCKQLKHLGADNKATDAARVLRLPNTINSRNNVECKVIIVNDKITYSMYDLREKYLKWKPKAFKEIEVENKVNNKKIKSKVLQFFTSYTLHIARAEDILTLCKLRKYKVTGYRNMILHCYAYWVGVTVRESSKLAEVVNELNNSFTEPLKQNEVDAILRCVPKAIEKFLDYEQGLRSGEVKRVSKGMRDKGGYWYKNKTLIEKLNITEEEQKELKTIIDEKEKYRRCATEKKEKQKAKRRNKDGLTPKQQELKELKVKILRLREQGMSIRKISEVLGKSKGTIENILKNKVS